MPLLQIPDPSFLFTPVRRSPYNLMDLIACVLPLFGSIQLLVNIAVYENTDALGNSRLLSYSIMAVYAHIVRHK